MFRYPSHPSFAGPNRLLIALPAVLMLALGACRSDNPVIEGSPQIQATAGGATACPEEGCEVTIAGISRQGEELSIAFDSNYSADMSRNHFHVFWDTFESEQVSDNAEPVYGVTQGAWEPTADNPYTTAGTVSLTARGEATQVCVTPADRDHNILDPEAVDCQDVTPYL